MSEYIALNNLSELITKGTTPNAKAGGFTESGVNYIKSESLSYQGQVDTSKFAFISNETHQSLRRSILQQDDVLVSIAGANLGKCGIVSKAMLPANTNQAVALIRVDKSKADPRFIHFYLRDPQFVANNLAGVAQSAQPNLNLGDIGRFQIPTFSLGKQREIAAVLGALDDKIDVNRKTAATLEAMARALYRSSFVSFDPVHARSQGKPPVHMDQTTAALFPDRFGDDGLPEGWKWSAFEDHYTVLESGKRPKGGAGSITEGVPSIGAESIKRIGFFDYGKTKFVPRVFFDAMRKGKISAGDILIYKDGGKPGELRPAVTYVSDVFPFPEACINEHVFRIRLDEALGQHFGFLALSSDHCMNQMRELATGVAQPGLNQSAMNALSFIMPSNLNILEAFNRAVAPLLDGCNEKAQENQTLATLRDTLLPKLMSGDLRVGAARKQIGDAL